MKTIRKIIYEHIKYRRSIFALAKSDIIKTYKGAALGWAWAIIMPSITLGVYYFAFTVGLRSSSPVEGYSYFLWLIAGFVPWFYMRDMLTAGAWSIRKYRYLVTKIKYPISTIPTFVSISHLVVNIMLIALVMIIFMLSGKPADIYWLQIPIYVCMMFMLLTMWSLFSSMIGTFSFDFLQLVKSSTIMLFWLSGIMYDVNRIHIDIIREIMRFNPVTIIVNGFRNSFIYKQWIWEDISELRNFIIVFFLLSAATMWIYKRTEKEVMDVL